MAWGNADEGTGHSHLRKRRRRHQRGEAWNTSRSMPAKMKKRPGSGCGASLAQASTLMRPISCDHRQCRTPRGYPRLSNLSKLITARSRREVEKTPRAETSPTHPGGAGSIFGGSSNLVPYASGATSALNLLGKVESWGITTGTTRSGHVAQGLFIDWCAAHQATA